LKVGPEIGSIIPLPNTAGLFDPRCTTDVCVEVSVPSDMRETWNKAIDEMRSEIEDSVWETWFPMLRYIGLQDDSVQVEVPNKYFGEYFEENFKDAVCHKIERLCGRSVDIAFVVGNGRKPFRTEGHLHNLNRKQTFVSFVVGDSNQFAHAASENVARSPGDNYNPLFIFGGVGVGKTHLLNAIGNQVLDADPTARVLYISAEEFCNDMINSLRHQRMERFHTRYRQSCDVLLVDDIHFLSGRKQTQEEFFHTFNALHGAGRQIAVTSDRYPREMDGIEERLRTRFEWGLVADIQPPELETRIAILQKKAETESIQLPDDVAFFIAKGVQGNVRELEGVLTRLQAFSSFYGRPITLDFAQSALRDFTETAESRLTIERIQEAVAKFFNIQVKDLKSPRRTKFIARPRQIAMYLCRRATDHSFPEIGAAFGKRHHTTVMHACDKIEAELEKDSDLRNKVASIERNLRI